MFVNAIEKFPSKIYLKRSKSKILEIPKLISAVGKNLTIALFGLHALIGCDSGKVNPFNVVLKSEKFMAAFLKLGQELNVDNDVFEALQEYTCQLYSKGTKSSGVNQLRYDLFRSKEGKINSSQLPPSEDTLRLHTLRANYQAHLWRHCLEQIVEVSPLNNGWIQRGEGALSIAWMTLQPALETILKYLNCKCRKDCIPEKCECIISRMKYTDMCHSFSCGNDMGDADEADIFSFDDDGDDDYDSDANFY